MCRCRRRTGGEHGRCCPCSMPPASCCGESARGRDASTPVRRRHHRHRHGRCANAAGRQDGRVLAPARRGAAIPRFARARTAIEGRAKRQRGVGSVRRTHASRHSKHAGLRTQLAACRRREEERCKATDSNFTSRIPMFCILPTSGTSTLTEYSSRHRRRRQDSQSSDERQPSNFGPPKFPCIVRGPADAAPHTQKREQE